MDIGKINLAERSEQGADLELEDPITGEKGKQADGSPVTIRVMGMDSAAFRNKHREIQSRRMAKIARGKKPDYAGNSDDEAAELLVACTIGWNGIEVNGEVLAFTPKAARDLYLDHHWIREQVDQFIGDRANFFTMS